MSTRKGRPTPTQRSALERMGQWGADLRDWLANQKGLNVEDPHGTMGGYGKTVEMRRISHAAASQPVEFIHLHHTPHGKQPDHQPYANPDKDRRLAGKQRRLARHAVIQRGPFKGWREAGYTVEDDDGAYAGADGFLDSDPLED